MTSGSDEPAVEIMNASGTLQVTNSAAGQAIFQAAGLAPGRSVTGTVQLSNTGTLAGDLSLAQLDVQDQPGPNGGLLSGAVQLAVQDITGGSSIPVFSGQLGVLGTRPLGSIGAGASRTYRFTASLPNTGTPAGPTAGDNAYEGSSVTVRYRWTASTSDGLEPAPERQPPSANPNTVVTPLHFSFRVRAAALARSGRYDLLVRCNRACSVASWGSLRKVPRGQVRRRNTWLPTPERTARVRVKLSRQARTALRRALEKRRRVALRVYFRVIPVGGASRTYSTTVWVGRPRRSGR